MQIDRGRTLKKMQLETRAELIEYIKGKKFNSIIIIILVNVKGKQGALYISSRFSITFRYP